MLIQWQAAPGFATLLANMQSSPAHIFDKDNVVKIAAVFWIVLGSLLCSSSWGADVSKSFETPTAYTLPTRIAIDKTDTIWFIESNLNKIGRFQPAKGVFSEYTIPTPSSAPTDLTISNTGKIWFTESDSDQLGVLDPASLTFKEYNIPTIQSMPSRIAADIHGNIWFTEFYGNKIGVFDPRKKVFREYPVPTLGSRPSGIVVDKNGIVWFVETEGNKLAKLNPRDGVIHEFALPTPHQTPREIAIDGSGALCIAGNIGRDLTVFNPVTKKFRIFVLPNNSVIESMTVASSGIIFGTLKTSGKISMFDPKTSKFMEFEVGIGKSKPIGIDTDSKGNIWFADKEKNALVRLDASIMKKLRLK
ncbi:MAG: hypothetical protein HYS19_04400 [Nitrosomonadales bacterium]|nr:hypothetical protein [Nitrosomonadales bacterium]